jgi:hypothetical protein
MIKDPRDPRRSILLLAGVLAVACSAAPTIVPTDGELAIGTWGGDSAGMIVGDTSMHLHVGCTFGDVSGRINLANDGTFDAGGTYTLHAFPVAVGPTDPARFTGKVNGTTAIVTATIQDTAQHQIVVHGPVVVSLGVAPQLGPCPICVRPVITKSLGARVEAGMSTRLRATAGRIRELVGAK